MTDKINNAPNEIIPQEEKDDFLAKAEEYLGLSEDALNLMLYWNSHEGRSHKTDFIDEMIMRTPDHVFDKYKALQTARDECTGEDAELAEFIASNIEYFLPLYKSVTLTEAHNYALARKAYPITRDMLKKVQNQSRKERE